MTANKRLQPTLGNPGAAEARRWAVWVRVRMSTEQYLSLRSCHQRHGAESARVLGVAAACAVESRRRSSSSASLGCIALSAAVGLASLGAGLRSTLRRRVRAVSCFAVQRRVAVRSVSSGLHPARLLRQTSLPNNAFEPTLESYATSLRAGCGAAQRKR